MKFTKTKFKGLYLIDIEKNVDKRGFFARTYDFNEFKKRKLETDYTVLAVSKNTNKATLRGMHFQKNPYSETKIVRCIKGSVFDVVIDLRPNSETYKKYYGVVLKDNQYKAIYIPKGFAHGFITLEDNSEVLYQICGEYKPSHAKGIRWNDPAFNIKWPLAPKVISDTDKNYPDYV